MLDGPKKAVDGSEAGVFIACGREDIFQRSEKADKADNVFVPLLLIGFVVKDGYGGDNCSAAKPALDLRL